MSNDLGLGAFFINDFCVCKFALSFFAKGICGLDHYLFSEDNFRKYGLDQFLLFQAEVPAARDCEVHPAQGGLPFHPHHLFL